MGAIVKEIYDAFRSAGVSDEQATAAAQSIPISTSLATKAEIGGVRTEIANLRTELHTEIAAVRAELADLRTELHTKIGAVRAELADLRTELHTEIGAVRAEMKGLELRMTVKLYAALGVAVGAVKALDFLIG